eukprot:scaffold71497_cov18-Prasinocladus_malaysianus.AAC.1
MSKEFRHFGSSSVDGPVGGEVSHAMLIVGTPSWKSDSRDERSDLVFWLRRFEFRSVPTSYEAPAYGMRVSLPVIVPELGHSRQLLSTYCH